MFDSSKLNFFPLCTYKDIDRMQYKLETYWKIHMKNKELTSLCKEHLQINAIKLNFPRMIDNEQ